MRSRPLNQKRARTAWVIFGCAVLVWAGCNAGVPRHGAPSPAVTRVRGPQPAPGAQFITAVEATLDRRLDPCEDFYHYACGGWLDRLNVPSAIGLWQRGTTEVQERIDRALLKILSSSRDDADAEMRGAQALFASCMGSASTPSVTLERLMADIDAATDTDSLARITGQLHRLGVAALFQLQIHPRWDRPAADIATLRQVSLLPAAIYLSGDLGSRGVLQIYRDRLGGFLVVAGASPAEAAVAVDAVIAVEGQLAVAARDPEIPDNPKDVFNIVSRDELERTVGGFPWQSYFDGLGNPNLTEFLVPNREYLGAMSAVIESSDPATIRAYLRWRLLLMASDYLNDDIAAARDRLAFQDSDWLWLDARTLRCLRVTESLAPEALARAYAAAMNADGPIRHAGAMIDGISVAFEDFIRQAGWLSAPTRQAALDKIRHVDRRVGLPSPAVAHAFEFDGDVFGTAAAVHGRRFDRQMMGVVQPPPSRDWFAAALEVNAFYLSETNSAIIPLGVLTPPMLDRDRPAAMNYGALGFLVGHELSHAVFLPGRYYDATGRLTEWWSADSDAGLANPRLCINDAVLDSGSSVSIHKTFTENLADAVGLRVAYRAWRASEASPSLPSAVPFSPEQLFFLAFAQTWCQRADPFVETVLRAVSHHSEPRVRINATVRQMPEFAAAFSCPAGAAMTGSDACALW